MMSLHAVAKESFLKDLTPQQTVVLIMLGLHDHLRLSDLSKKTVVTHGTMVVAIQKLAKKGLVNKKRDKMDERAVSISLSSKGKVVHQRIQDSLAKRYEIVCNGLSNDNVERLVDSYRSTTEIFAKYRQGPHI